MKKTPATPLQAKAGADGLAALRSALKLANPALSDDALEDLVSQATDTSVRREPAPKRAPAIPPLAGQPTFKAPAQYRLLEKAFFPSVMVQQGDEWVPLTDAFLDPEAQPLVNKLSGTFGGRGNAERVALVIRYEGIPDEHMEPLNDAAEWSMDHIDELKAHYAAHRPKKRGRRNNPVDALVIVGHGATVLKPATESV